MAKLYSNENFAIRTVKKLRELGHDVLTSAESGRANKGIPDEDVLTYATEQERILLTFNRRDFIRLHMDNPDHAGIITCTYDANPVALSERIHAALLEQDDMKGRLVRITKPGS